MIKPNPTGPGDERTYKKNMSRPRVGFQSFFNVLTQISPFLAMFG